MSFEIQDVERKVLAILKVLHSLQNPAGSSIIARILQDQGIILSERAVRYHLKLTDERGLTELVSNRGGRIITEKGLAEIKRALVKDKVGFTITKIELLTCRTGFNFETMRGLIPVNVTFFHRSVFPRALQLMKPIFDSGLCVSSLTTVADSGEKIGDIIVPHDMVGFATVCSIIINGALLKAGIPMDSRFGGLLQMDNSSPKRFTEIIYYNGCSLDPSEIFIKAGMTSVYRAALAGSGEILANFREIPSICLPEVESVLRNLKRAKVNGVIVTGFPSESVCEIQVEPNKVGMVLMGGLNPVAAVHETGIVTENKSMATVVDYQDLIEFQELLYERDKNYTMS
jgi:repressor of nif and glnA expression